MTKAHLQKIETLQAEHGLSSTAALRMLGVLSDSELAAALSGHTNQPLADDSEFEYVEIENRGISLKFLKTSALKNTVADAILAPSERSAPVQRERGGRGRLHCVPSE